MVHVDAVVGEDVPQVAARRDISKCGQLLALLDNRDGHELGGRGVAVATPRLLANVLLESLRGSTKKAELHLMNKEDDMGRQAGEESNARHAFVFSSSYL